MARRRRILIGCPQYRKLVAGTYDCDDRGRYRLGSDGEFLLEHVRCDQLDGRCMQTLCVLHRHNRGGPDSWHPSEVLAAAPSTRRRRRRRPPAPAAGEGVDLLA